MTSIPFNSPTEFHPRALISETVSSLAARLGGGSSRLQMRFDAHLPCAARGDGRRIREMVTGLVLAALEHAGRGEVMVDAALLEETLEGGRLRVSVRAAEGDGKSAFVPAAVATLAAGASGAEAGPDQGFALWFETELLRGGVGGAESAMPLPAGMRILVVNAEAAEREALVAELKTCGAKVETADDGDAALALLRTRAVGGTPFQALVVDWMLAPTTGLQLAVAVRADEVLAPTPLVMVAPTGEIAAATMATALGVEAFLVRPLRDSQLQRALGRVAARDDGATAAAVRPRDGAAQRPDAVRGLRLLLAEDNPANQAVGRMLLGKMGFVVDVASNGEEALARLAAEHYDAVLMDCQMPVLDGFETTRLIRNGGTRGVNPRLPVIALMACAKADEWRRCQEAGMDASLSKPVRLHELRGALSRCGLPRPAAAAT